MRENLNVMAFTLVECCLEIVLVVKVEILCATKFILERLGVQEPGTDLYTTGGGGGLGCKVKCEVRWSYKSPTFVMFVLCV